MVEEVTPAWEQRVVTLHGGRRRQSPVSKDKTTTASAQSAELRLILRWRADGYQRFDQGLEICWIPDSVGYIKTSEVKNLRDNCGPLS